MIQAMRERGKTRVLFPTVPRSASFGDRASASAPSDASVSVFSGGAPRLGSRPFGDRLAACVAGRESQVVLGLDPDPMALWPGSWPDRGLPAAQAAAEAVAVHCQALIDAAGPACVAAKLQLACFEALGMLGWAALEAVVAHAREAGLLVIADGKRGDIDVSARAYARGLIGALQTPLGAIQGLGADMVTVNPLMGSDAMRPFVEVARQAGAGVLVLVRTSNPGAAEVQDAELAGGGAVWERIAALVDELDRDGEGHGGVPGAGGPSAEGQGDVPGAEPSGLSDLGAVIGATAPQHVARARELMPRAVFLLPGVGAQGGHVEDLAPAFAPGRAAGLITASRSIAHAHLKSGGDPATAARAEAERLRVLAWALA
jgi:orotidine-5'-phosphate decarboxylase